MKTKLITILCLALLVQSCNIGATSPDRYFGKAALNTNSYSNFGSQDFERYMSQKEQNALFIKTEEDEWIQQDNVEKHLTTFIIPTIEEKLKEIKNLKETDATAEMLKASIKLHEIIIDTYKTDYITVAKLIDANTPQQEINNAITQLNTDHFDTYWELHENLMAIAIPYAEANGIEVSRY